MDSCKSSNIEISDHFRDVTKMVTLGSSAKRKVKDFLLTRYACYLIAQNGELRSEYGKNVLQKLSDKLTAEFGKGFSVRTLQQMKKFYTLFPIANALRSQLTWTHYRSLLKVSNESARNWYIEEAIKEQWSSRQLRSKRQPSSRWFSPYPYYCS